MYYFRESIVYIVIYVIFVVLCYNWQIYYHNQNATFYVYFCQYAKIFFNLKTTTKSFEKHTFKIYPSLKILKYFFYDDVDIQANTTTTFLQYHITKPVCFTWQRLQNYKKNLFLFLFNKIKVRFILC